MYRNDADKDEIFNNVNLKDPKILNPPFLEKYDLPNKMAEEKENKGNSQIQKRLVSHKSEHSPKPYLRSSNGPQENTNPSVKFRIQNLNQNQNLPKQSFKIPAKNQNSPNKNQNHNSTNRNKIGDLIKNNNKPSPNKTPTFNTNDPQIDLSAQQIPSENSRKRSLDSSQDQETNLKIKQSQKEPPMHMEAMLAAPSTSQTASAMETDSGKVEDSTNKKGTQDQTQNDEHNSKVAQNKIEVMKFTEFDNQTQAPYKIYIQNKSGMDKKIEAIEIAKFLIPLYPDKNTFKEIKQLGRNKICVIVNNRRIANEILKKLSQWEELNLTPFIPNHLMVRRGVVKGISADISNEWLLANIEMDIPVGNIETLHIRRFTTKKYNSDTDKTEIVPTKTIQITIRGQFLPSEAKIMKVVHPIEIYYPQVRQCYRCYRFGHIKANCKAPNEKCIRCGSVQHKKDQVCERQNLPPQCILCGGNHLPINKTCTIRQKEQEIRDTATRMNLTVSEIKGNLKNNRRLPQQNFPALSYNSNQHFNLPAQNDNKTTYAKIVSAHNPHNIQVNIIPEFTYNEKEMYGNNYSFSFDKQNKIKNNSQNNSTSQKLQEIRTLHKKAIWFPNGELPRGEREINNITSPITYTESSSSETEVLNEDVKEIRKLLKTRTIDQIFKAVWYLVNTTRTTPGYNPNYNREEDLNHYPHPVDQNSGTQSPYYSQELTQSQIISSQETDN